MTSKVIYEGHLHTEATHIQSGTVIETDAPVDNHGTGASFSPTDLVATALASCMMTVMGIAADTHGIDMTGSEAEVTKIMHANPRKIQEIRVVMHIKGKGPFTEKNIEILKHAGLTCPVCETLGNNCNKNVTFTFENTTA